MFDFVLQTFIKSNLNPQQNKETQILPVTNLVFALWSKFTNLEANWLKIDFSATLEY